MTVAASGSAANRAFIFFRTRGSWPFISGPAPYHGACSRIASPSRCIPDREGILWAGTFSGIWKFDLRTRQFSLVGPELFDREKADFRFPVSAVCQDSRKWLWIGTYKNGLFGVNRATDERKTFAALPGKPQGLKETLIPALQVDRGQTLWIGTNSGLHSYDILRDRFTGYYHSGENGGGLSNDSIMTIFEDRSGRLWVGTEDGLNLFDRGQGRFHVYRNDLPSAARVGRNVIIAIYPGHGAAPCGSAPMAAGSSFSIPKMAGSSAITATGTMIPPV